VASRTTYRQEYFGNEFKNSNPKEYQRILDSALQSIMDNIGERRDVYVNPNGQITISSKAKPIVENNNQKGISLLMNALAEIELLKSNQKPIYNLYAPVELQNNTKPVQDLREALALGMIAPEAIRLADRGSRKAKPLSNIDNMDEVSDNFVTMIFSQGAGRDVDTGSPNSLQKLHAGHREDANLFPELASDLGNINPTQTATSNQVTAASAKGINKSGTSSAKQSADAQIDAALKYIRESPITKYTDDPDDFIPVEFDPDSALKAEEADEILRQIAKERASTYKFNNQNNKGSIQNAMRDAIDGNEKNLTINTDGGPVYLGKGINGNGNAKKR